MPWVARDGTKRHNWTTNSTIAEDEIHKLAQALIDGCHHLTPATEAEIDNLLTLRTSEATYDTDHEPDPEVLAAMKEPELDWVNEEPSNAALRAIEREPADADSLAIEKPI